MIRDIIGVMSNLENIFAHATQFYWTIKISFNFSRRIAWSLLTTQTHIIDDQSICSWLNRDYVYEGLNFFFPSLVLKSQKLKTYKLDRKTVDDE